MATITFKNGEEYALKLSQLANQKLTKVCGAGIYDAAELVTDAIRQELEGVPTDERWGTKETPTIGPRAVQKEALLNTLGVAEMQTDENGFLNVKIGFDGYNHVTTKRWPSGQPNQMVARAIESGTSWMRKNRFVSRAVNKTRKRAIEVMRKRVETEIEKIMK